MKENDVTQQENKGEADANSNCVCVRCGSPLETRLSAEGSVLVFP